MNPIYLDYNATTPVDPAVAEAMEPFLRRHFGNPSSSHYYGLQCRRAVEHARRQVADLLGCRPEELIFTSGGSESNNYAIKGVVWAHRRQGNHIITSAIEHPAVMEVCRYLQGKGFQVTFLQVDEYGMVDPVRVEEAITPQTVLITIMHANNEVGTIEPLSDIAAIAKKHEILIHSDGAQSIGKIPVKVQELGVDLLSVAGHKIYAPKGIGALYVRTGVEVEKLIHGAGHEMNRRAGTENVMEIVGLGKACELVQKKLPEHQAHLRKLRDRLASGLKENFPEVRINGHPEKRLPNTLSISFPGLEANTILAELRNVAASAGAACHSDQVEVSHVLEAMGVPLKYAMGTIRFSVGRFTSTAEIDKALEEISQVVRRLQPAGDKIDLVTPGEVVKLTHFTHGLGCACKIRPQILEELLQKFPASADKNVMIGADTSDDAAVYRIDDQIAVVQTVDFFTPVVDDPFQFGAIAAANSLSDIYAMGASPLFALNIVGFPSSRLPVSVLEKILAGAESKAQEAGISIIGGHTVEDTEPKFGLAVTGTVHPDKLVTNQGAKPGDVLVLTKPLGTGILSTALKQGLLTIEQTTLLMQTMAALNKPAAEAMQQVGVHACTDVTGFGLPGHLLEMIRNLPLTAKIENEKVPFLPGVEEMAMNNQIPGGTRDNYSYTQPFIEYAKHVSEIRRLMLNDAQTSGGLLISVAESRAEDLLTLLKTGGVKYACIIGQMLPEEKYKIRII